jgi:urea ABC transporter ATP-binding protein UrtD
MVEPAEDVSLPAGPPTRPILEARALSRRFGGLKALDGVDLAIERGELLGIIGPNGAGKSTLFNVVTGQLPPDGGQVLFDGRDITDLSPHLISRLGVGRKFQVPSVFDGLTIRQNLHVAARGHSSVRSLLVAPDGGSGSLESILDRLGLSGKAELEAGFLSHGEKQWLEIGMVLANRPSLLLLDEPTAGMTLGETKRTEELLRGLGQDHTIVVIEHDVRFIREVAQRVVVLHRGKVLASGPIDEVERDDRVRDVYLGREE